MNPMIDLRIVERAILTDNELNALFSLSWERHERRSFQSVLASSLTYFAAFNGDRLIGFVNVAWDGGAHAFLLDPTVVPDQRRKGIGAALVRSAAAAASVAGAEWLHVDYDPASANFYAAVGFRPSQAGVLRLADAAPLAESKRAFGIEYRRGPTALPVSDFVELTHRVWSRELEAMRVAAALARTLNIGAWRDGQLVGAIRVLTDGYLLNTIPEVMVDPECRRQGIGRELMYQALTLAPGGRLFFGAQSGNEPFFERIGFVRGPTGFVGRLEAMRNLRAG